jgi:hypothetical protein
MNVERLARYIKSDVTELLSTLDRLCDAEVGKLRLRKDGTYTVVNWKKYQEAIGRFSWIKLWIRMGSSIHELTDAEYGRWVKLLQVAGRLPNPGRIEWTDEMDRELRERGEERERAEKREERGGGMGGERETILPSPQDFMTEWNRHSPPLPKIVDMGPGRVAKLRLRKKRETFRMKWREMIFRMAMTGFYIGQNDRGWKAGVDWFLRNDENPVRFLEGSSPEKGRGKYAEVGRDDEED